MKIRRLLGVSLGNKETLRFGMQSAVNRLGGLDMLNYAILFLVIALVAAVLGFGGLAGTAAWIAKVLFIVFLVLFVVGLIMGRRRVV